MTLLEMAKWAERLTGGHSDAEIAERNSFNDAVHTLMSEPKVVVPLNYGASLDAAMTLVPEGWSREVFDADNGDALCRFDRGDHDIDVRAKTWPLALCAAALRARAVTKETNDD